MSKLKAKIRTKKKSFVRNLCKFIENRLTILSVCVVYCVLSCLARSDCHSFTVQPEMLTSAHIVDKYSLCCWFVLRRHTKHTNQRTYVRPNEQTETHIWYLYILLFIHTDTISVCVWYGIAGNNRILLCSAQYIEYSTVSTPFEWLERKIERDKRVKTEKKNNNTNQHSDNNTTLHHRNV